MTIRANIDPRFFLRYVLIAIVCIGFGFYCLYDGFIGYPNQILRAEKFIEIQDENGYVQESAWKKACEENGWSHEYPEEPKTEADIAVQFIMAGVCFPIGFFALSLYLRSLGRWIEASEKGINSSWGQSFYFGEILHLNKKKWDNKGIAKILYSKDKKNKSFVLDNYKFNRDSTTHILLIVESKLRPDQYVNGYPEPSTDAVEMDQVSDKHEVAASHTIDS